MKTASLVLLSLWGCFVLTGGARARETDQQEEMPAYAGPAMGIEDFPLDIQVILYQKRVQQMRENERTKQAWQQGSEWDALLAKLRQDIPLETSPTTLEIAEVFVDSGAISTKPAPAPSDE